MDAENGRFRGALNGFNRQDVAAYIEKMAKEHQEQMEVLRAELEQARKEKETLAEELENLRSESGELADQEARVRASLEESTQSLTALRGELQMTQGHLTMAKKELGDLQAKVARLEPMARQYEVLKDRVATVELDAHRKAQETVAQAEAQAADVRQAAAAWVSGLSRSYEAMREQVNACALRADEATRAFAEGEATYQALLDCVIPERTGEERL